MQPLGRKSRGTKQQDHEQRIESLERRIIPGPPSLAFLRRTTDFPINPGGPLVPFETFRTTDRDVFATTTQALYPDENNQPDDDVLLVKQEGMIVANLVLDWEPGTFYRSGIIQSTSSEPALADGGSPATLNNLDQATYSTYLGTNFPFGVTPEQISFFATQDDGVARDITSMRAIVLFWPADALATSVYG